MNAALQVILSAVTRWRYSPPPDGELLHVLTADSITPTAGGPLALAGTFVLLSALFALTAHVAARYVLGDVPVKRALLVGPVPAAITLLLQQWPAAVMLVAGVVGDFLVIRAAYRIGNRGGAVVTLIHYTVTVILSVTVANLLALLSTAPGG